MRAWSPLKDFSLLPPPNQNKPMGKSLYQSLKRTLCEIPVEDFMNENLGIVVDCSTWFKPWAFESDQSES